MLLKILAYNSERHQCRCENEEGDIIRLGILPQDVPVEPVGKTLEVEGLFPYMYLAHSVKVKE
jgi:hypothetical protein